MTDTTTALAVRRPAPISGYQPPPSEDEFRGMIYMAKQLSEVQGFVPAHFFKQPNKILAAMLYGRDLGITPTNAMQHIIVIEGKATADAQLMGMLVRRAGHRLEDKTTAESSTVTITRGDDGTSHVFTFTMQDARRAGLVRQGSAWEKYPQAMLFARALTGCARKGAQDALMGVAYTPEELGMEVVPDGGFTGEIPIDQAAPETVNALQGAQVASEGGSQPASPAAGPTPMAAVVTPPAPSVNQGRSVGPTPGGEVTDTAPANPAPPPPTAAVMPLSGPALARRMGAGRSIGPAPKRTNVVTVEQGATKPATPPEVPIQPFVPPDIPASQQAPPALTDEADLPEPVDPGKQVYLDQLRGDLRVQTAALFRVNVLLDNVKRGLEGKEPNEVPPATPSEASDNALAGRIDQDYPGRKLANLGESELAALTERFEANLARKRDVLQERGISEE